MIVSRPSFPFLSPFATGRRRLLQAGALASLGLAATGGGRLQGGTLGGAGGGDGFGRAKRCLLLFMWGGPSHIDTFDMKPEAPAEIRGPFRPIATAAPGVSICEHFQQLAKVMDKATVVRSLGHDDPAHLSSAHTLLTGQLPPVNKSDDVPPSDRDTPHIGAVMSRLRESQGALPPFVTMPWQTSHPAAPGGKAPGQHGGWLGHAYDPFLVDGDPSQPGWSVPALSLLDGVSGQRLLRRHALLGEIDRQRGALDQSAIAGVLDVHQSTAIDLLTSPEVREAFDLAAESETTRDRYGRNIHGQCVLLARRLLERGVSLVSVNWHNDGQNFWDTHGNNFPRLEKDLIPPSDRALAALLGELDERGLLEETIVAWVGEFGRAPRINGSQGRDHYPYCYSGLLAGAGIRRGAVYGASDAGGAFPTDSPVSPHDFTATLLHALGVHPGTSLPDRLGRPHPLYGGLPIVGAFG